MPDVRVVPPVATEVVVRNPAVTVEVRPAGVLSVAQAARPQVGVLAWAPVRGVRLLDPKRAVVVLPLMLPEVVPSDGLYPSLSLYPSLDLYPRGD